MNTPLIEQAITEHFGKRCCEPEPGCPACNAWHELDTLKAKSLKYEAIIPAIEGINAICEYVAKQPDMEEYRCDTCLYTASYMHVQDQPPDCPLCRSSTMTIIEEP